MEPDRIARINLALVCEPGDLRISRLLRFLTPVQLWQQLLNTPNSEIYRDLSARIAQLNPEAELKKATSYGVRFIIPSDPEWPTKLTDLSPVAVQNLGGAPLGLWVKGPGELKAAAKEAVAIVGARSATSYGVNVAAQLAVEIAESGSPIISGAAFGVDQSAHRGALAVDATTIAVLASGLDRFYPAAHQQLLEAIAATGLVISELPLGASPTKLRFLARNRIIAGLADAVVIVEAAARSGALNTANWANRLHRQVLGVPGPITSATSVGVHNLIRRQEATLVTNGNEIATLLKPIGQQYEIPAMKKTTLWDRLTNHEKQVLDAMPGKYPIGLSELAQLAGLSKTRVLLALETLERNQLVTATMDAVDIEASSWELS